MNWRPTSFRLTGCRTSHGRLDIVGTVTAKAAKETGLAEGTPVICGTVDAAAEAISVGVLEPRDMMLMYGSTIFIIAVTSARVKDGRLWYAPWLFPGQHASMAGLATSGTLTHWFRENMARELDPARAIKELAAEAEASPPGAKGLVMLPYFSGERTPIHDTHAKGAILGLDLTHTRGDLFRATLEGIALATNHIMETFDDVGEPPQNVFAVGGGTQNRVWAQAHVGYLRENANPAREIHGRFLRQRVSCGSRCGRCAVEGYQNLESGCRGIHRQKENAEIYRKHYEVFRSLYERNKDLMKTLGS